MLKRFGWFILTNFLILATVSVVINLLGVKPYLNANGIDFNALMIFCLVWGMGGAFISLQMSRFMAKKLMGVQLVDATATGEAGWVARRTLELARSAGIPEPEVGIYDSPEPNAFATGPSKKRSLVAVSTGLLRSMTQEEVEGVLAHEVAHIKNGDMVTMTLIQGVMNAVVMFIARVVAFAVSQLSPREETRPMINMVVTIVLDIALAFLAMFAVSYFSRQREFRADAGAAMLAGRQKMISALERLQRFQNGVAVDEPASLAAFKISGRRSGGILSLLSTHPPLEARIEALKNFR